MFSVSIYEYYDIYIYMYTYTHESPRILEGELLKMHSATKFGVSVKG